MKRLFLDLETTGVDVAKHGIHQIAGYIETPQGSSSFDFQVRPAEGKMCSQEALEIAGVTIEQLRDYPPTRDVYERLTSILGQHVDKYDKRDKFQLFAFNAKFDAEFLRQWFHDNNDVYFGSWFWHPPIDIMTLAAHALMDRRPAMTNFKLGTVAQELGIETNEVELHNAFYDIDLARQIYERLTATQAEGATA